jgi:hypothetical protein
MLWLIITDITWVKLGLILLVFAIYQGAVAVLSRTPSVDPPSGPGGGPSPLGSTT